MKQDRSNKYNLAWFKLAEFVSRGEKEKALGIFKLLAHSLNDVAYIYKLEGDILFAFNDKKSEEFYSKSASFYRKGNNKYEAISLYLNLLSINPDSEHYLESLMDLYEELNLDEKSIKGINFLFDLYVNKKDFPKISNILKILDKKNKPDILANLHKDLLFELCINGKNKRLMILYHLKRSIEGLIDLPDFNQFLSELELTNKDIYEDAIKYIESRK